jgi:lactonase family protein with 7-bladed beta-propeller
LTELSASPFELSATPPPASSTFVTAPAMPSSGAFGYLTVWKPSPTPTATLYGATLDATTGDLAEVAGMPMAAGYEAQSPVLDPTGKFAFLPRDTAPNSSGEIVSYNVSSPSGVLTANGTPASTGGNRPIAALTSDGKFVLVSNAASGTFVVMAVDTAGTVSMLGSPIVTGTAGTSPGVPIYTRRLGVVYLANAPSVGGAVPSLAAYRVDSTTGALTMLTGSPFSSNGATLFPLPHPSGKFLYQVNGSTGSLQRYSLDQTTGVPTLVGDVTTPTDVPSFIVPDPSGRYMYATSSTGGSVSSYSVNQTSGALTLVNTLPAGAGAFLPQPVGLQ